MKDKEREMNCHRLEDTKGTRQINAMWDPVLYPEVEKGKSGILVTYE